jgi:hypothetical protein
MRSALIIALSLILPVFAVAESVEVKEIKRQPSSRHVRIAVSLNGRSVPHATVDFCVAGSEPCISAVADENGIAVSPRLPDGNYIVTASLEDISAGDLYLHVSRKGKASAFSLDLTESFRAEQSSLAAADQLPIRETLQVFRGFIRDPSGANVPGANIKIMRRGSENHAVVRRVKTDQNGYFSAQLDDGKYVAFFLSSGFRSEIVPFEIAPQGSKELLVKLQIGQSSESVRITAKN